MTMRLLLMFFVVFGFCLFLIAGLNEMVAPWVFQWNAATVAEWTPTPESVVMHLKELSELTAAQTTVQVIVTSEEVNRILGIELGSTRLLYVALGEVRAGINLSELDVNRISVSDCVIVFLPQARILDTKIDINRSFVYDVRQSVFFAPDEVPLHSAAQREALKRVEKAALETGLLELANRNAAEVVKSFVEEIVDKEVVVLVE